jgi:hypothetical protein
MPNKSETYRVEGDNAELRHYLARLARRSRYFSRCVDALRAAIKLFVFAWNSRQLYKKTVSKVRRTFERFYMNSMFPTPPMIRWCDDICLMVYSEGDSFHSPLSGRCLSCQFYLTGFMLYVFLTSYAFLTSRLILGGDTVSHWQGKYVIGLTGNIAVGKSVVRQMLQHLGAYTIDADSLAHQAMMPGAPAYKTVVSTFGQMIVGEDGRINRAALGNIVFGNPQALKN